MASSSAKGYGLMSLTPRAGPPKDLEDSFACMQAALDAGATHWNGGEFYGSPERNSLTLLNAFYEAHPEAAAKVTLNIKGGLVPGFKIDGSAANMRRSVENCVRMLGPRGKIDMYECARRDRNVPLAETLGELGKLVAEGKIGGIALSEVNANTIREAAAITKIAAVEIELSLTHADALHNGVAAACKELGIPIYAYSPIGHGFLSGTITSVSDLPEGDFRRHLPRMQDEHIAANLRLVEVVQKMAAAKNCTPSQLALGWLHTLSTRDDMPQIIPIPGSSKPERVRQNSIVVMLSDDDMKSLDDALAQFPMTGTRYPAELMDLLDG